MMMIYRSSKSNNQKTLQLFQWKKVGGRGGKGGQKSCDNNILYSCKFLIVHPYLIFNHKIIQMIIIVELD